MEKLGPQGDGETWAVRVGDSTSWAVGPHTGDADDVPFLGLIASYVK